jgi:hypothetical protein
MSEKAVGKEKNVTMKKTVKKRNNYLKPAARRAATGRLF